MDIRQVAMHLIKNAHEDELAHLQLRIIRDNQAPRFEALKDAHPKIYEDFIEARKGPHETLLRNREALVEVLKNIIEGNETELEEFANQI